jgi:Rod binding domain-containing protein
MSGLDAVALSTPGIVPADVRKAGAQAEKTYRAALGFERMLTEQLTKTMATGTEATGDDGEESGASAATSAYRDMLPGTLADAVTNAGGLGLAHDLYRTMRSAS